MAPGHRIWRGGQRRRVSALSRRFARTMRDSIFTRRAFAAGTACALAVPRALAAAADPFDYRGRDRAAFLEAGARREGRMMFYSSLIPNLGLKAITDAFKRKYPFVAVES